jgi:hypothetical protein
MYRKLAERKENVLGYHISGTVTDDEIEEIHRDLQSTLRQWGKARLLMEFGELSVPAPSAIWEDLKLTPEYVKDVERYAIVGDRRWQELATRLVNTVTQGEARYFEDSDLEQAWNWIQEE